MQCTTRNSKWHHSLFMVPHSPCILNLLRKPGIKDFNQNVYYIIDVCWLTCKNLNKNWFKKNHQKENLSISYFSNFFKISYIFSFFSAGRSWPAEWGCGMPSRGELVVWASFHHNQLRATPLIVMCVTRVLLPLVREKQTSTYNVALKSGPTKSTTVNSQTIPYLGLGLGLGIRSRVRERVRVR